MLATRPPLTGQLRELRPDPRRRIYGTVAIRSEIAGIGHGATYGSARSCSLASNYWYIKRDPPRKSPVAPVIQVSTRTVLRRPPVTVRVADFHRAVLHGALPCAASCSRGGGGWGAVGFFGTRWAVLRRISSSPTRSSRSASPVHKLTNNVTSTRHHQHHVLLCMLAVCSGRKLRRRRCVSVVRIVSLCTATSSNSKDHVACLMLTPRVWLSFY